MAHLSLSPTALGGVGTSTTFSERDVQKGFISMIEMDCPVTMMIPKKPAPLRNIHEWQLKNFAAPDYTAIAEGVKPTDANFQNNLANKNMLAGRFQKIWRPIAVTKEAKLMANQYSVSNLLADNIADKTAELYVDIESLLLSDQDSKPAASGVGSQTRSIVRWASNNDARFVAGTGANNDSATIPPSYSVAGSGVAGSAGGPVTRTPLASIVAGATAATITEAQLNTLILSVATTRKKQGMRFTGLCQPDVRNTFDDFSKVDKTFTGTANYPVSRFAQEQGSIDREITRYKSSMGSVELMTTFRMTSEVLFLLLSPELLALKYAQSVMVTPLAENAVQDERVIDVLLVNEMLNPQAFGKIISTATGAAGAANSAGSGATGFVNM